MIDSTNNIYNNYDVLTNKYNNNVLIIPADKNYALQEVINDNQPTQYRKRKTKGSRNLFFIFFN